MGCLRTPYVFTEFCKILFFCGFLFDWVALAVVIYPSATQSFLEYSGTASCSGCVAKRVSV